MRPCSDDKACSLKSECVMAGASLLAHVTLIKRGRGGRGLTKDNSLSSRLLVGPGRNRILSQLT